MVFTNLLSIRHFLIVFLHIFKIYNYTTRLAYQDSEKTYWLRVIKKCLINTLRKIDLSVILCHLHFRQSIKIYLVLLYLFMPEAHLPL